MIRIVERIEHEGQPFVDEPIRVHARQRSILERSVGQIFGSNDEPPSITVGHNRVKLRWMKPDGNGGLEPR